MSTLAIEERFTVDAEPSAVFAFLLDPQRLVACMPGAELEEVESDRVFLGTVKVKVGAVAIAYKGRIELTFVDEAALRIRAEGEGREKGGAGKVTVSIDGEVAAADGGGAQVILTANVKLAGKIVRLGRGLIGAVSKQIFAEFAAAVAVRVPLTASASSAGPLSPDATATDLAMAAPTAPLRALPLLFQTLRQTLQQALRRWLASFTGRAS